MRVHHVMVLKAADTDRIGPIAVTSAYRTLLDIGTVGSLRWEVAFESALRQSLVTTAACAGTSADSPLGAVPASRR